MDSTKVFPLEMDPSKKLQHRNSHGMHWVVAAIFVVGDMLGAGMIALPIAVSHTGLMMGITLILLAALFSSFTGLQLGKSWAMMQVRWPEYQDHCRRPYPEIAYRAQGAGARLLTSIVVCITQYGLITVLTILAAKNLSNFFSAIFDFHLHFCYIVVILAVLIWPFSLLRSPNDFWWAAVCSAGSSVIAGIIIFLGTLNDAKVCGPIAEHHEFDVKEMLLGYGTIVFAYGGHSAFPTIQHDMHKPFRFNRSIIASYIIIVTVYLAVASSGYVVYGNSMRDTIMPSLQTTWMSQAVNIMITLHVLPTIIIVFSPIAQQIEDWANVPHSFTYKRVVVRTIILIFITFTALSVPDFGVFMDLVGATTMSLMTMILPSVFYLYLKTSERKRKFMLREKKLPIDHPDEEYATLRDIFEYTPKDELLMNLCSLAFGVIGGIAGTSAALHTLFSNPDMSSPCYVNWIREGFHFGGDHPGHVNCCGPFRNVSVFGYDPVQYCAV